LLRWPGGGEDWREYNRRYVRPAGFQKSAYSRDLGR
jgi:hypothetical protein